MSTTALLAYTRWHVRDAFVRAIAPVAIFAALALLNIWGLASRFSMVEIRATGELHDGVQRFYDQMMPLAMTLGALTVGSGFVAVDRERGHVRFLFSTPIVAWQYYLLRLVVGMLTFTAAYALVPLGFGWFVFDVPVLPVLASAALYATVFGSLGILAGALTQRDGAVVIVTTLLSMSLHLIVRAGAPGVPAWMVWAERILPPIATADVVRTAWLAGAAPDAADLTRVLGYSAAMLVTALFTIHRAPLVR
ncbi:MAG: ABC transporter permease [Gemmatimonadaceae bacterium]|nr:ABC transporter permease [Gemmatimonadaceae bacterium]